MWSMWWLRARSGVGKTALERRFVEGTFATTGKSSYGFYLGLKKLDLDGRRVTIEGTPPPAPPNQ
jgi:replicative DNA helicase